MELLPSLQQVLLITTEEIEDKKYELRKINKNANSLKLCN